VKHPKLDTNGGLMLARMVKRNWKNKSDLDFSFRDRFWCL